MDLHGVPQGLSEVLLRPQRCVYTQFSSVAVDNTFFASGFCSVVKRLHPALQRSLEDHGDNYRSHPPAERGRSAISLGLAIAQSGGAEHYRGAHESHAK